MAISNLKPPSSSALSKLSASASKSFQRLSTGQRINSASDDPAGAAVVAALESNATTSRQAVRNISDGVSALSMADSAMSALSDITMRQNELAMQASNETVSDTQRQALDQEFQQLEQEKTRIKETTQFNGQSVFKGYSLQVGSDGDKSSQLSTPSTSGGTGYSAQSIATLEGARASLDESRQQIQQFADSRGQIGAAQARLSTAQQGAANAADESTAAASRIKDADYADETAKRVAIKIKQDGATALQAQAGKLNVDAIKRLLS